MQQLDTQERPTVSAVTSYGFSHAKGIVLGCLLLIAASFMKGGKAKKMQRQETRVVNYDLSKFEKNIQESKKLLKGKRP